MNDLEEALRSALRERAEAADREVSLLGPVACRVRQERRRCSLVVSVLTAIVGIGATVTVTASPVLQLAQSAPSVVSVKSGRPGQPVASARAKSLKGTLGAYASMNDAGSPAVMAGSRIAHLPRGSLQSVMLAYGSRLPIPADWRWHDFGGIRFAAPASWVVGVEGDAWWVSCPYGVAPMTVLLHSAALRSAYGCGKLSMTGTGRLTSVSTGVVVGAGRDAAIEINSGALAPCWLLGGLRACALQPAGNDALKVAVFSPGTAHPALVEIGLGRSAVTAQRIFDSIRPSPGKELALPPRIRAVLRG